MTIHNVAEAKAQLSRLLDEAMAGGDVVLARNGTPLVRLVPVEPLPVRELGFLALDTPDSRFAPLTGDELDGWT